MNVAVTRHAVERYKQRVTSAAKLDAEAVRSYIREVVERAFQDKTIRDHPTEKNRRLVPFEIGNEKMWLSLGPNDTDYPGDFAVIGVLYDGEVGKTATGATLADVVSEETKKELAALTKAPPAKAKYLVRIGGSHSKEIYEAKDDADLTNLITRRAPKPDEVEVFERKLVTVKQIYVIEK